MKKIISKIKNLKKKKLVNEKETHEEWLGAEARVSFSKEDTQFIKRRK
jgi:hypothetical protein